GSNSPSKKQKPTTTKGSSQPKMFQSTKTSTTDKDPKTGSINQSSKESQTNPQKRASHGKNTDTATNNHACKNWH
ncbi:hypothetical protein, partial [Tessaracoccus lapidicaptus]|uniref:hypothetical protein n=1 Tax=Tessaracoccus lapidicaptus TaxID=1427523 RepID=UPI001C400A73